MSRCNVTLESMIEPAWSSEVVIYFITDRRVDEREVRPTQNAACVKGGGVEGGGIKSVLNSRLDTEQKRGYETKLSYQSCLQSFR